MTSGKFFQIDVSHVQVLALSLAKLSFSRPGWKVYLRRVAENLSAAATFDEFVVHGPESRLVVEEVLQRLVPEKVEAIRFQFQVNGVVALWARKHGLSIGTAEIDELCACLTLDPRTIVPIGGSGD